MLRSTFFLRSSMTLLAGLISLGLLSETTARAQKKTAVKRARPPKFTPQDTEGVFFDDVFKVVVGSRPKSFQASRPAAGAPSGEGSTVATGIWSSIISATSIEDEVKSLKLELDQSVTTPTRFRGQGHEAARREFTLLTVLFFTVEHFDGEVKWQATARAVRQQFASVAGNAKAGGNEQVYSQAKRSRELLEKLLRGERLELEATDAEDDWEPVTPRPPLMSLLEGRFEADLKQWTSRQSEFDDNIEDLLREAELVGMIAQFLTSPGMDDAEDAEYKGFAQQLKQGSSDLVAAVKQNNFDMAQKGVSLISRSCVACHDTYR